MEHHNMTDILMSNIKLAVMAFVLGILSITIKELQVLALILSVAASAISIYKSLKKK